MKEIKHYFPGANTKNRFYNLFGYINDSAAPGFLYILKGGPGTGKSTMMKKIGETFHDLGFNMEYFHCSSDYDSLDGVRIAEFNIAVVDGTAPHVTEASMPGIKEKIINLGEFIDSKIRENEKQITEYLEKKQLFFNTAYFYIQNASNLYECNNKLFSYLNKEFNPETAIRNIIDELNLPELNKTGKKRKLFQSAVADDGTVDFANLNNYSEIAVLPYNNYLSGIILNGISEYLISCGYDVTCFLEILSPDITESIYIPGPDILITKKPENETGADKFSEIINHNNGAISSALQNAAAAITEAKNMHKKVEEYYVRCMDFSSLNEITARLIEEIKRGVLS